MDDEYGYYDIEGSHEYTITRDMYGQYIKTLHRKRVQLSESEAITRIIQDNSADIVRIVDDWLQDRDDVYDSFTTTDFIIKLLKDDRVNMTQQNNYVFKWALRKGYDNITHFLLDQQEIIDHSGASKLFEDAFFTRNLAVAETILTKFDIDPSFDNNYAVRYAINNGHMTFARMIMACKKFDFNIGSYGITRCAVIRNNKEIYEEIMSNGVSFDDDILFDALEYNRSWAIKSLMKNTSAMVNMSDVTRDALVGKRLLPTYKSRKVKPVLTEA